MNVSGIWKEIENNAEKIWGNNDLKVLKFDDSYIWWCCQNLSVLLPEISMNAASFLSSCSHSFAAASYFVTWRPAFPNFSVSFTLSP